MLKFNESGLGAKCDALVKRILSFTLTECSETRKLLAFYNSLAPECVTNQHVLTELSWVIYSSGFRNDIVKKYWPAITEALHHFEVMKVALMADDLEHQAMKVCEISGFRNLRKAVWCIKNAKRIMSFDLEKSSIGGLKGYISLLSRKSSSELVQYAPSLVQELKFIGLGNTTIFHFMKNMGLDIFKPDIHVRRILSGLRMISNENSPVTEVCDAMAYLSSMTGLRVSELDTLLFVYGKATGDYIG